jgi:hypothetical protein
MSKTHNCIYLAPPKGTIYIIRHREGTTTNCVSRKSFFDVQDVCKKIKELNVQKVLTRYPYNDKHIRPIQTAANICSLINKSVELFYDASSLPDIDNCNILIVWNHNDMNSILSRYGLIGKVDWPDDNYQGCIRITEFGWEYDSNFLNNNSFLEDCCMHLLL